MCRTIVDHLVRTGSDITSQQPLHEVKALVQQNGNSLQTMEVILKVKMVAGHVVTQLESTCFHITGHRSKAVLERSNSGLPLPILLFCCHSDSGSCYHWIPPLSTSTGAGGQEVFLVSFNHGRAGATIHCCSALQYFHFHFTAMSN